MSLKDNIRNADDRSRELVPVPEWGDGVQILVKSMSIAERNGLAKLTKGVDPTDVENTLPTEEVMEFGTELYFTVLELTCYDPDTDNRLFGPEDRAWLGDKNPDVLDRLVEVGSKLSGLGEDAVEEGKAG